MTNTPEQPTPARPTLSREQRQAAADALVRSMQAGEDDLVDDFAARWGQLHRDPQ